MMSEKEFNASQEECARMLGMTLDEYLNYCKNIKVPTDDTKYKSKNINLSKTEEFLDYLGIQKNMLKKEKQC